jgi:type II secretory pathway component GspD/PulD (secretin)
MVNLFLCSCTYIKDLPQRDPFVKLYTFKPEKKVSSLQKKDKSVSLTISAVGMPLSKFCRVLSDKTSIGIVYNQSLASSAVTGEFKISNIGEVLNVIARQLNTECLRVGETYFLGKIKKEDRGILVKKVRGFSPDELSQCIKTLLSDVGKVQVFQSGTVCVSDREHVLTRVSQMCEAIEAGFAGSWIVQLYFVVVRKDALVEAGFDMQSSGKLSYDISNSTISVEDLKLDGLFNLISRSNYADMYASPMLLLRDGVKGTWRDGERIPIPKKVVSQYGVVETQGFEYIDTGLNIDSTIRESKSGAVLNIKVSLSDVKGYVEYAPITSQCEFTAECELKQNKVYLIGEISRYKVLDTQKKILNLGTDRGKSTVQVWGCVYRIGEICKGEIIKPRNKMVQGVQSLL